MFANKGKLRAYVPQPHKNSILWSDSDVEWEVQPMGTFGNRIAYHDGIWAQSTEIVTEELLNGLTTCRTLCVIDCTDEMHKAVLDKLVELVSIEKASRADDAAVLAGSLAKLSETPVYINDLKI
ncbi:hypothetical protein VPHD528_0152 [Vibrio phage D528]